MSGLQTIARFGILFGESGQIRPATCLMEGQRKMKFTVVLIEGRTPKRAIGLFDTREEADAWARADGWAAECYRVLELSL